MLSIASTSRCRASATVRRLFSSTSTAVSRNTSERFGHARDLVAASRGNGRAEIAAGDRQHAAAERGQAREQAAVDVEPDDQARADEAQRHDRSEDDLRPAAESTARRGPPSRSPASRPRLGRLSRSSAGSTAGRSPRSPARRRRRPRARLAGSKGCCRDRRSNGRAAPPAGEKAGRSGARKSPRGRATLRAIGGAGRVNNGRSACVVGGGRAQEPVVDRQHLGIGTLLWQKPGHLPRQTDGSGARLAGSGRR